MKKASSTKPRPFNWSIKDQPRAAQAASMKSSDSSSQSAQSKDG